MPQIPRYDGFVSGTASGGQLSLGAAAAPWNALAQAGRDASRTTNEFLRAKVEAERTAEVADRLSTSVQAFEDWDLNQDPYGPDGKPRYKGLAEDADKAWGNISRKAMDDVTDQVIAERLQLRMQDYYARRRMDVGVKAHKWEIEHRSGQLQSSLYKFADLAARADSYDMVERYIADGQAALQGALVSGVISETDAAKLDRKFTDDMFSGYIRKQIYSGNYQEASATLQAAIAQDPGAAMTQPTYVTLMSEMVSEMARVERLGRERRERAVDALATDLMVRAANGEQTVAELDALASSGLLTDASEYNTLRTAILNFQDGTDDPEALRHLSNLYAQGKLNIQTLAGMSSHLSAATYKGFAFSLQQSQASPNAKMFDDDVFREGRKLLEQRLRTSGPLANITDEERVVIPRAIAEYTSEMMSRWQKSGGLDYLDVVQFAEDMATRYEAQMKGVRGTSVLHAPPPRYKSPDEARQAYEASALGAPGSDLAKSRLRRELEAIRMYEQRKSLERKSQSKSLDDSLRSAP